MAGVVVSVPDVMDDGGGVYPQSPEYERVRFLLDLRRGAQRQPHHKFHPTAPKFAAIGVLREEEIVAKTWFDFSELGRRGPPAR
jgi:hypothetical protein